MRSKVKILLIILVAVFLLGGVTAYLVLTAEPDEVVDETPEVTSRLLYDKDPAKVEAIVIENEFAKYEILRVEVEEVPLWVVPEYVDSPTDWDYLESVANAAATLTSQQLVAEAATDLSIYGLDEPSVSYAVKFEDDENFADKILLGDIVPGTNNSKVYMKFASENAVHTVNKYDMNVFYNDKKEAINKLIFTQKTPNSAEDTTDYTQVFELKINRKDLDYDFIVEKDKTITDEDAVSANASGYLLTSPAKLILDPNTCAPIIEGLYGFSASDFVTLNATEEDMVKFGLDDPYAEVYAHTASGEIRFFIGDKFYDEEDVHTGYYGYVDGLNIIYIFDNASLPWIDIMPLDITISMITTSYVYDLETVELVTENGTDLFEVSGNDAETLSATLNGDAMDTQLFKDFYMFILKAPAETLYSGEVPEKPYATVKVKSIKGGDTLEFYELEGRRTAISLNGDVSFTCKTAYVDRLLNNLELVKNGEQIINNW